MHKNKTLIFINNNRQKKKRNNKKRFSTGTLYFKYIMLDLTFLYLIICKVMNLYAKKNNVHETYANT